jgi:proline-specific peptidase
MSAPIQEGYLDFSHPSLSQPAKTWYRVYGDLTSKSSGSPLVVLNGGPGASYHYMTPVADLASGKASPTPVVFYDQIGTGQSTHFPDKKGDGAFWSMELFLADLENLLKKLGIDGQFDILGHSWGGMLGASLAIKQPAGLRRLVLADTLASMPLWVEGTNRLLRQLPEELQEVIRRCEADGKTDSEEYERATQVFYSKFVCRLDPWPEELATSLEWMAVKDPTVYSTWYVSYT